jgi:hypothetical protein
MLEKAEKRNKGYIENGRSEFIATDLSNSNLPGSYFDSIIAFNVNFFWKDPVKDTFRDKYYSSRTDREKAN